MNNTPLLKSKKNDKCKYKYLNILYINIVVLPKDKNLTHTQKVGGNVQPQLSLIG